VKKHRTKKLALHRETLQRLTLGSGVILGGIRTGNVSCGDGQGGCLSEAGLCGTNEPTCNNSCAYGCTNMTCAPDTEYACCA